MLKETYPYYLANEPVAANTDLEVTNKYTGAVATRVALADGSSFKGSIDMGRKSASTGSGSSQPQTEVAMAAKG